MNPLRNRVPPVLVAAVYGLLMWLGSSAEGLSLTVWQLLMASEFLLLAGAICLAALQVLRQASTTVNALAPQQASSLVASGIYRYSRKSNVAGLLHRAVRLGRGIRVAVCEAGRGAFVLTIQCLQIAPEENALEQRFGESFRLFMARVRLLDIAVHP